jgi:hypothetical protein
MKLLLLILFPFLMGAQQIEDSLIALSNRLPDTTVTKSLLYGNKQYTYIIKNSSTSASFELVNKKTLFIDYRKIGGLSYFFGMWAVMLGYSAIEADKVKHFVAGYGIGVLTYSVTKKHKIAKAIVMAFAVGALKETVYDSMLGKGTPSVKDFVCTGVGGYYGSITIPMFKTKPIIHPYIIP